MSDWQPIETAPRDGTEILLFTTFMHSGPFYIVACWEAPTPRTHPWYSAGEGVSYSENLFTHWLPLPPPPKTEK